MPECKVRPGLKVRRVRRALPDLQVPKVPKVLPVPQVLLVLQAHRGRLVRKDPSAQ